MKLRALALLTTALLWIGPAQAEALALLIGVSGYPQLPESRRLRGPRNDVPMMQEALQRAGMPLANIRLLADGVAGSQGLPTRAAILNDLAQLAADSRAGDWVVVYFSGHGSQQPQPADTPAALREADGLDEIFLPYDIGRWDGRLGRVAGALVDDDIGAALRAVQARGARLWAIFDTCHAGDMAKSWGSGDGLRRERNVPANELGTPQSAPVATTHPGHANAKAKASGRKPALRQAVPGAVIFYASQADEPAAEEALPLAFATRHAKPAGPALPPDRQVYGYFSYLIAQELTLPGGQNLATLAQRVSERYRSRPFPTPGFEGELRQELRFPGRSP